MSQQVCSQGCAHPITEDQYQRLNLDVLPCSPSMQADSPMKNTSAVALQRSHPSSLSACLGHSTVATVQYLMYLI
jgi:hypothetical protein